jgi:hypothetical protein
MTVNLTNEREHMNEYKHVNEISELATSRVRWIIACYTTMALWILTLILAAVGAI